MSRQAGEYQVTVAVLILPENLNRCKPYFEQRRELCPNRLAPSAGCLQPERRGHVFSSYPTPPIYAPAARRFSATAARAPSTATPRRA